MSVGSKEVGLYHKGEKVIERKVPLPVKWIKGLTTVQIYQSVAEQLYSFNRIQTLQLFQTLPKSSVKCDYYLVMRGQKPAFSPVKRHECRLHWRTSSLTSARALASICR